MARAADPLLHADAAKVDRGTSLRLTGAGARVRAGKADHVTESGIDRWIGGVRLSGREVRWRWNEGTETITSA
jgi:hypothetical protein